MSRPTQGTHNQQTPLTGWCVSLLPPEASALNQVIDLILLRYVGIVSSGFCYHKIWFQILESDSSVAASCYLLSNHLSPVSLGSSLLCPPWSIWSSSCSCTLLCLWLATPHGYLSFLLPPFLYHPLYLPRSIYPKFLCLTIEASG